MSTFSMNSALPNLLVTYAVCTVVLFFVVKVCNFYGANMVAVRAASGPLT